MYPSIALRLRSLALFLAPVLFAGGGAAQQGGSDFNNAREAMWPAPTAEDWKRPCLLEFQRTWEDAVSVSEATGKAILVCVNMDGEIASEHYAGIRYRQPEIATIYEPYVLVIASVYRHTPRDFDEEGRRILCPRFGSVTCGEHITIEPLLYEMFLDERRIAPRHIGVELDGKEMYDVYYAFDTDSVFQTIADGQKGRPEPKPLDVAQGPIEERVTSRDIADREAVEEAYQTGDRVVRRKLIRKAVEAEEGAPVDLLRLAVFDLDVELNRLARQALANATSESAIELINEALRVPMGPTEREALITALARLGETYPRARTLAAVHRGLARRSEAVDVETWAKALDETRAPVEAVDRLALEYRLENKSRNSKSRSEDPEALLEYAEASLALAVDPETAVALAADRRTGSKYSSLMFEDVRRAALRAEELGSEGWRVDAVIGIAAFYLGDVEAAHVRAEAAVSAMPSGEEGWNAMGALAIFAQARQQAITQALREKKEWPAQWLTDVNASYSVLARHPLGTEAQVIAHYDFLRRLGAGGQAARVLDQGFERFPESWELHARLRGRVLWEKGVGGLESVYATMLEANGTSGNLEWFAGYASLVAAEFRRREAGDEEALAAYDRAVAHYERAIELNPDCRATADHYIAMAIAGRARVALEREEYELAVNELLASFERKPEAAASLDGLGLSPVATATTLRARLNESNRTDLVAKLQTALDGLDPELLLPPEFERQGPRGRGPQRGQSRRR